MRAYLLLLAAVALTVLLVLLAARPAGQHSLPDEGVVTPLTVAGAVIRGAP